MLKKLTVLLCTLALIMSCACALAENTVYEMPELEMTLTLPDTMAVLNADTDESVFAKRGFDKNMIVEAMQANDTYMLIYPSEEDIEVNVVMTESIWKTWMAWTLRPWRCLAIRSNRIWKM